MFHACTAYYCMTVWYTAVNGVSSTVTAILKTVPCQLERLAVALGPLCSFGQQVRVGSHLLYKQHNID